ncbi:MAG: flagellar operon protein YvyF [Lachnospiraceae bacterium]|nr:flagellar operon protein YvyF [Lachnospiraceae bacterium]
MDGLEAGLIDYYNIPRLCKECRGVMIFKGVGEYQCESCGYVDYDDYGKVRLYIEKHKGATAAEIEMVTGVSQRAIRRMLRESRIEIAEGSKTFLHCEVCNKDIRSGRFCNECEIKLHRNVEAAQREELRKKVKIMGVGRRGEEGQRRFIREEQ